MGSVPDKAHGYGATTSRYVFGVNTNYPLAGLITYKAWDNVETFPITDPVGNTTSNTIFTGTTGNGSLPMLCLIDTTLNTPVSSWKPSSVTAGSANPNRLKGDTNYITQEGDIAQGNNGNYTAEPEITFNMQLEIPYDVGITPTLGYDLVIGFIYTGPTPTLKLQFNAGTQESRDWVDIPTNSSGIVHTRINSGVGNLISKIPDTGVESTVEGWVVVSL